MKGRIITRNGKNIIVLSLKDDTTGKYYQKWVSCGNKRDCKKKLAELEVQYRTKICKEETMLEDRQKEKIFSLYKEGFGYRRIAKRLQVKKVRQIQQFLERSTDESIIALRNARRLRYFPWEKVCVSDSDIVDFYMACDKKLMETARHFGISTWRVYEELYTQGMIEDVAPSLLSFFKARDAKREAECNAEHLTLVEESTPQLVIEDKEEKLDGFLDDILSTLNKAKADKGNLEKLLSAALEENEELKCLLAKAEDRLRETETKAARWSAKLVEVQQLMASLGR